MHFLAVWPSWCLEDAFGVRRFSYSHLSAMVVKGFAFNSISLSHAHCEECGYPPMLTWKDEWVNIIGIQRTPQNTEGSNYVTNCMTKLCCILMVENCGGTDTTNLQAAESQLDRITASNYYSKEDHHFVWIICNIQGIFSNPITSPSIVCRAVLAKSLLWFSNDESRGTKYLYSQLAPVSSSNNTFSSTDLDNRRLGSGAQVSPMIKVSLMMYDPMAQIKFTWSTVEVPVQSCSVPSWDKSVLEMTKHPVAYSCSDPNP